MAVDSLLAAYRWPVWPALVFDLGAYCAVTSLFHYIPGDPWQMSIFVKNRAIAGGCLVLAAHGPGRFALSP